MLAVAVRLSTAVLCTHIERSCIISGGFDGYTYLIDPHTSVVISRRKFHRGSILSIAVDDKYIVSVGEDSMLVVSDRRQTEAAYRLPVSDQVTSNS